jgi:hypothetical protein
MTIGFLRSIKLKVVHPSGNMVDAESAFTDGFTGQIDFDNPADGHMGA